MKRIVILLLVFLFAVACSPNDIVTEQTIPAAPQPETSQADTAEESLRTSGGSDESAATSNLASDSSYYYGGSIFEDTTFSNTVAFPEIGATTTLLRRNYPDFSQESGISLDEAREIANRLDFTGPIYEEQMQVYEMPVDADVARPVFPDGFPRILIAFKDDQRLTFHETGFTINRERAEIEFQPITADSLIPIDQLIQQAESIFNDIGLLDREYTTKRGWGNSVQFLPIVNGIALQSPFATIEFANDGEFIYLEHNNFPLPTAYEEETAVSAQAAFDLLIENPDRFTYDYIEFELPIDEGIPFPEPMNWQREIIDGQPYNLQMWLTVYQPADGNGTPLIFGNNYQIIGDEAKLAELIQAPNPVLLQGVPNTNNGKKTFTVDSWKQIDLFIEPYVQGTVDRQPDTVWLDAENGQRLSILDAPAELTTGMEIGLEYWSIENNEVNWAFIFANNVQDVLFEEPMPAAEPWQQPTINAVTFNEIGQTYSYFYRGFNAEPFVGEGDEEMLQIETPIDEGELFAIHWVFTGVTDEGRDIIFYVPAVEMPPEIDYSIYEEAPPAIELLPEPDTQ